MTGPSSLRVSVLLFYPFLRRSQTNRLFFEAIQNTPGVISRDLYELYPEFSIDVEEEQKQLSQTDVIVFQHPFYWYSCPSLMKEWMDSVLEYGWAYGAGGQALKGKYWLQAISTGGSVNAYHHEGSNRFTVPELLRPFEQTAVLCNMIPLQPVLTLGSSLLSEKERLAKAQEYRKFLIDLTQGKLPPVYSSHSLQKNIIQKEIR